ncbi:AraC family transcriptional regulator [Pseudozobellia thermophila]|uniref:Transcriptional regulator, AraC family n=1 Tax=Pseudozobellia thermophila TaxID=192903 RepID=A0A1M6EIW9_9FLAO|nr:AraC family transcriptional regulator [Pseudozobellia thermophila]SHI85391.1 transcriptional regulator, AraC family [Pseudozobellia thermophila]
MEVIEAYKPFEIQELTLKEWKKRPVKNNFFELVWVRQGQGKQCINYNEHSYAQGDIFLHPPLKCHSFTIQEPSTFVFLKFSDTFFKQVGRSAIDRKAWFNEASYILSNYNQLPGSIIKSEVDRQHMERLIDMILQESRNQTESFNGLITSLLTGILEILMRNIKKTIYFESIENQTDDRIVRILQYLNENISDPEKLKIESLSDRFSMSPTYVSEYFKKQVHMSLREYIIKARLKLVEIRLLNSDYSLGEIADELGFTDVSHLSKTFKRYVGLSIREFKNQGEYRMLTRNVCTA